VGGRQGGHRACRSWERRHELPSRPDDVSGGEARTHTPVRSPDRDGAIGDGDFHDQEVTHAYTRFPQGCDCGAALGPAGVHSTRLKCLVSGRVSVDVSVPLGIARSIHRSMCDHVGSVGPAGAQRCHVALVDCRWAPGARQNIGCSGVCCFARVPRSATENSVGPRPAPRVFLSNVSGRPGRRSVATRRGYQAGLDGCRHSADAIGESGSP